MAITRLIWKLSLFVLCVTITGCYSVLSGLYGLKRLAPIDERTILRYAKKYNIPRTDLYELDTAYHSFLQNLDTVRYKPQRINHSQPLQALYYDSTGQFVSFQINCYAGGFPNLKWNRNNIMQTFPPGQQAPLDSILPLDVHLRYLRSLSQTPPVADDDHYDVFVIVHWNRYTGRQSKRLIRVVQENRKLSPGKRVKFFFVNTDNFLTLAKERAR